MSGQHRKQAETGSQQYPRTWFGNCADLEIDRSQRILTTCIRVAENLKKTVVSADGNIYRQCDGKECPRKAIAGIRAQRKVEKKTRVVDRIWPGEIDAIVIGVQEYRCAI